MYCEHCDLAVETEWIRVMDAETAMHYRQWFDPSDIRGPYATSEVGSLVAKGGETFEVRMRVDLCANCAVPLDARTYLREA